MTTGSPILVLGASGLVGGDLVRAARRRGLSVLGAARTALGEATVEVDVTDAAALGALVDRSTPSAIAIAAAWSHVDGCESDPERSARENVGGARAIVTAAAGAQIPIVFFSTDQVFDGTRDAHVESDPTHPLNVYARHKLLAEEIVRAQPRGLVVRTAWVFGEEIRQKNFAYRVASAARSGARLLLPRGQVGCPTSSRWLSDATLDFVAEGMRGVVHLTGSEPHSKAEWARTIARSLGLPAPNVEEVDEAGAGQIAPRPARVVLASERHGLRQAPVGSLLEQLRI